MIDQIFWMDSQFPFILRAVFFLFGTCIGSFLNVCIYRIPVGKSIVFPGSHCACGAAINWYHNIPVFSWLLLRGKARCCGRSFSIRYPFVEALTGGLFLACWMLFPPDKAFAGMVFVSILIPATFIDLDHLIIPDRYTIGGMVVGVCIAFAIPALHGFQGDLWLLESMRSTIVAVTGAFIGSALILWIGLIGEIVFRKEAMGFGDVKFMGAIGAFCGWQGTIFALFGGAIVGTIGVILLFIFGLFRPAAANFADGGDVEGKKIGNRSEHVGDDDDPPRFLGRHVPFGPMLAVAALLYFLIFKPQFDQNIAEFAELIFNTRY